MILGSLLRQFKQAIFIFLLFIFLILVREVVGSYILYVFPPLARRLVLIIIAGFPSPLPQNVARVSWSKQTFKHDYMETGHIEINVKLPDSVGRLLST